MNTEQSQILLANKTQEVISGWCLTSGSIGHETQCLGVFEYLGIQPQIKRVNPQGWYKNLAPIGPAAPDAEITPPWPDLLIVSGRQSLPYARKIKRVTRGKTFIAVLQSPGLPSSWFNFIWVPEHDKVRGANIVTTLTPPHRLSAHRLLAGSETLQEKVKDLPRPLVTVLIGGPSRSYQFGEQEALRLCSDLIDLHQKTGCGFLISPSYRTHQTVLNLLQHKLSNLPALIWDMTESNPYLGFMALADYFIVTCDSVNMIGEAAYTGRPVYAYPIPGGQEKFDSFHRAMITHGAMKWFNGELESWTYPAVNATPVIAEEIWRRLALHRKTWKQ